MSYLLHSPRSRALALAVLALCATAQVPAETRTVDVAQIVPRSGPLANVGNEIHGITRAAFEDFNGVQGELTLRLVSHDDGNVGNRSAELAAGVPKDAMAYLSCFGTVGCLAQQKVAGQRRVPLVGPIAGAAALRGPGSGMVYALRASAADELKTLLTYAQTAGLSPLAVLVQDDGFGRAYASELVKLQGGFKNITFETLAFKPDGPDFRAVVERLRAAQPKALLLLANAAHSTSFLNTWREQASLPFVFNLAGQANAMFANRLKGYQGAAAFVTVTPSPWSTRHAMQRDYQRVAARAGLPASYLGFEAYLNARVLIDSLQRSGARNAAELSHYLDGLQSRDFGGVVVEYAQNRRGSSFTDLSLLRNDGTYVH
jgi:ABC-type branched-subunit amino acid transport system substrate-binding protein